MRRINLNKVISKDEEVIFYPYRKAQVYGIIEIYAESEEEMRDYKHLQEQLCKMTTKVLSSKGELVEPNGVVTPDNHTCFMVGKTAIMFSDWEIRIGTELVLKNW